MEKPIYSSETQSRAASVVRSPDPPPGDPGKIGRYRIVRLLGQGGFGRVYLARDDDLDRSVAIKVPNRERVAATGDVEAYLAEARALAKLDHPNVVPVYDLGRTDDGICYVVSKYIEGSDLAERLRQGRPTFQESVELAAVVAGALHHAHTRGLVHRDIKPANILIDTSKEPWVADFGLALKDEDYGKGARLAGTPAYMSPEQARGEGHRVDGRSDIFSLGVVLYELLTGRKPFRGDTRSEVMDQIATADPRPLRQIDDTIPRELDRICQKALAKRASERYSTGRDMADDLRHFLQADVMSGSPPLAGPSTVVSPPAVSTQEVTPPPQTSARSDSEGRAVKIVPKGLRSFDRHDADFFLELLPGPRDRDGLPQVLRFWKTRIESRDPDTTFRVALIYGPSGCGKSSLVKAGLLPRLAKDILPVYIEATPEDTEARLLKGLRKVCPDLPTDMTLVDALAALRRGRVVRPGQKVLLVIDQFEQWLFARRTENNTEVVAALRQCDGEHVQAVVMVRDDFWMAATRFMRDLEIRLVEGENSAAVDLFDLRHARRVLSAFGRAYGVLPEKTSEFTPEQKAFLEQSVAGLAQDGKVISVRLALFAEMVKGKPWTPAALRDVGGTQGVGVTFLDETFGASTAPPEHRLHQKAAQAILKALLPQSGTDIKGQMRSEAELREASGYASRPRDFDDVIGILDPELRLISPTDPEGSGSEVQSAKPPGHRYYQLTHDYLVPSLRDWLTRKQRETRRGRAELRLAERASMWDSKPENRYLPSIAEWLRIRTLTRSKSWTDAERRMMRRAGRVLGLRALGLTAIAVALVFGGFKAWTGVVAADESAAKAATGFVQQILKAETPGVLQAIEAIKDYRRWTDPELNQIIKEPWVEPRTKLHASLALLPVDPGQVDYLATRLRGATPAELSVLIGALRRHGNRLAGELWKDLQTAKSGDPGVLPLAGALAQFEPDNSRWAEQVDKIAEGLVHVDSDSLDAWIAALSPVNRLLSPKLVAIFSNKDRPESERMLATKILANYLRDDPKVLAKLLLVAQPMEFLSLFSVAQERQDEVAPVLEAELSQSVEPSWHDPPIEPSWTKPDSDVERSIESARGLLKDRFAFCQTMALDECRDLCEKLREYGYRPVRFRPFADKNSVKVAAVWTRDGRKWKLESELSAEEISRRDQQYLAQKLRPVDVAGYVRIGGDGKPSDRYAALWVESTDEENVEIFAGLDRSQANLTRDRLMAADLNPRTTQIMRGADGGLRFCGIWGRVSANDVTSQAFHDLFETNFDLTKKSRKDQLVKDVSVCGADRPVTIGDRAGEALERIEKVLAFQPDDLEARLARANWYLRLGEIEKALNDLRIAVVKDPQSVPARQEWAIALARNGQKQEATVELEKLKNLSVPEYSKLYAAAVVAAELGEDPGKALESLEATINERPQDLLPRFDAARALALASKAVNGRDPAEGQKLAVRALQRLKEVVHHPDADFARIDDDAALDSIRDDPALVEILKEAHCDRRYAAVWTRESGYESEVNEGLDPLGQLRSAQEMIDRDFRPVAWSVARIGTDLPLVTASAWRKPVVSESEKDALAERQARAAVALIRLGKVETAWPLLVHGADPRVRSFIINWLKPMEVGPGPIALELNRIDAGGSARRGLTGAGARVDRSAPRSALGKMDSILFHRETSTRRALIQALGTYALESLPSTERDALVEKLLSLHRDDPDSGIHGAVEWTLRQWKLQDKLKSSGADAIDFDARGDRRWYVNRQGQTFAVINGPVEFLMGSPPNEPDRSAAIESPKRMAIPRTYAIATEEVSVEQFRRFLKEFNQTRLNAISMTQASPDPTGPWVTATWYQAARYCNWLSKQEGFSDDQCCYITSEAGAFGEGMKIPANVLERTGYRLPTEPEWEYACRAGTVTSRYYGHSIAILKHYARYMANSDDHAWPAGTVLPNDLGLFDMLGNAYEWCQDANKDWRRAEARVFRDVMFMSESITEKRRCMLRGGSDSDEAPQIRSASRATDLVSYDSTVYGFRLARTLP